MLSDRLEVCRIFNQVAKLYKLKLRKYDRRKLQRCLSEASMDLTWGIFKVSCLIQIILP